MSIYSALMSKSTVKTVSLTTPATNAEKTYVYVTIPNWANYATIKNISIKAITEGALAKVSIAVYETTPTTAEIGAAALTEITLDANKAGGVDLDTYVEDTAKSNFLYISIHGTIPASTSFEIDVEGEVHTSSLLSDDATSILKDPSFRVLKYDSVAGKLIDFTPMLSNGFFVDNSSPSRNTPALLSVNDDKFYIGSGKPLSKLRFMVADKSSQAVTETLTVKYLKNDDTFATATVEYNGTTFLPATPSAFQFPGIIKIASATWADAKAAQLTSTLTSTVDDPLYVMETAIKAGEYPPIPFFINPDRYWLEFSLSAVGKPLVIGSIHQLK